MKLARFLMTCLALSLLVVGCADDEAVGPLGDGSTDTDRRPVVSDRPHFCIGDYVWFDANGNGCQDAEEVGVAGVVVELYTDCDAPESVAATFLLWGARSVVSAARSLFH